MKRLIAITNGDLKYEDIDVDISKAEDMTMLKTLDSTNVKTGICPQCTYSPLEKKEGYLICKNCGAAYKIFDNQVYLVR
jgi:uncharacterized protein YbaR (Trm112 family)